MKRCPVCRGRHLDNHRCRRCGADLLPLAEIEEAAGDACAAAILALAGNDITAARHHAKEALFKRKTDFHQVLNDFIRRNTL